MAPGPDQLHQLAEVAGFELAPGLIQVSRETASAASWSAPTCAVVTGSFVADAEGRAGAGQDSRGLLDELGWHVRKPAVRDAALANRRPGVAAAGLRAAVRHVRQRQDGLLVFTGIPFADRRHFGAVAARHSNVDLRRRRFHRLSGVAVLNGLVMISPSAACVRGTPWTQAIREGALTRLRRC